MSRFSTKADLYDVITIQKSFKEFKKRYPKIYIGHSDEPIKYKFMRDLVPYYPYIPWYSAISTGKTDGVIRLSEESYVDTMEKEGVVSPGFIEILRGYLEEETERSKQDGYDKLVQFN